MTRSNVCAAGAVLLLGVSASLAACGAPATPVESSASTVARQPYGEVDLQISCESPLQPAFDEGLALLHHMWYERARERFQRVAEADPECAIAHWGVAMTYYTPLWAPPTTEELANGRRSAERAAAARTASARERRFVDAVVAFYREERPYPERAEAFEQAFLRAHEADPEDGEAAAFYALALLATAPPTDQTYAQQEAAGAILERLLVSAPRHPGAHHYLIHAYDSPTLAERAVPVARRYAAIAPSVPHALHMPTHIFVRLGLWDDVIDWNRRSADVARENPVDGRSSLHYLHALDYLVFAYLQQGRDAEARAVLEELRAARDPQPTMPAAYAAIAIPARLALETQDWGAAARMRPEHAGSFEWASWPWIEANVQLTRAVGAARGGDIASAERAVTALVQLDEATRARGEPLWEPQVRASRGIAEAWLAQARGRTEEALEHMRAAAEAQASVDKHPVNPSHLVDAWESLGELSMEAGDPEAALGAFERALERTPNRYRSIYGAARATRALEDRDPGYAERSRAYFEQLLAITARSDGSRPELAEARQYLASRRATARVDATTRTPGTR